MTLEGMPSEPVDISPDRQEAPDMPDIHKAMYLMGNHPAKMVTLLALTTFPPDEYITKGGLRKRLVTLQEGVSDWTPGPQVLLGYCKNAMQPPGFVEFGAGTGSKRRNNVQPEGVRLTEKGRLLGPVVAGALLNLELESMGRSDSGHQPLFLQVVMGSGQCSKGRIIGSPTRLTVYDALLRHSPEGIAEAELRTESGLSYAHLTGVTQDLGQLGVLCKDDDYDDKRTFNLSDKLVGFSGRTVAPEMAAVIAALVNLRVEGTTTASVKDILGRAQQMRPDLSRSIMSKLFTRWLYPSRNASLVQEVKLSSDNQRYHTRISIPGEHREYLKELLQIRQMLVEDSPEAEAFREAASQQASVIVSSAKQIGRLLAQSKRMSGSVKRYRAGDWIHNVAQLIPGEGIDAIELHRKVMEAYGRKLTYASFRGRLNHLSDIVISKGTGRGQPGKPTGLVFKKKKVFSRDWVKDAACKDEDPELFHPEVNPGPLNPEVLQQVEAAKAFCHDCPVKLPCLKTALDTKEQEVVRGEVWFSRKSKEMTPERKRFIQEVVEIR